MLSLKQRTHDGELVLRDPLTGIAVGLEEADLCDGLREWLLATGAGMLEQDAADSDGSDGAAA